MDLTQQSIHPRVVDGKTAGPKVNTCKAPNKDVARRKAAAVEAHLERQPRDLYSRKHLDALRSKL
jgi:hypothetical protein